MAKILVTLGAFLYVLNASAVLFQCSDKSKTETVVQIDLDTHPIGAQAEMIEIHTYIDSVDYGRGDVLEGKELVAEAIIPSMSQAKLTFENGMKLVVNKKTTGGSCLFPLGFTKDESSQEEILCCKAL